MNAALRISTHPQSANLQHFNPARNSATSSHSLLQSTVKKQATLLLEKK